MLTIEKYYDRAEDAIAALTATTNKLDYRIGLMYNIETGDCFYLTIRGKEEFAAFAAAAIDLLQAMCEDAHPVRTGDVRD
jgi:hypothetical protein